MQLSPGIHDLVGNQVIRLIIKLFFGNNVGPFRFSIFGKRHDYNIVRR